MGAGVSLAGLDPWANIGATVGGGGAAELLGGASLLSAAIPGGGWAQIGGQVLGAMLRGDSTQSGAASGAELNTSGWVVGEGDAEGGSLDAQRGAALPWWAWPVGALLAVAILKKIYQS